jgi:uncharacterized protein YegL
MPTDPFDIVDEIPRKVMTLFYLVDTSGSMSGAKISALNTAVRETLPIIEEISKSNSDSKIKIAVLEFSSGCEWMYPTPTEVGSFEWRDLQAGGLTSLGEAYDNLSQKLSHSHGFMMEATGSFAPVIILLSDGAPTDQPEHALEKLRSNKWFKVATKVAIAIGDDCIKSTLIDFTGNEEAVLTVHNVDELKKIIRMVSVTASRVNSKNTSAGKDAPDKATETVNTIQNDIANDPTLKGIDVGSSTTNAGTDDWAGW